MSNAGTVIVITDPSDPRINDYTNLKDVSLRKRIEPQQGLFIAESARVIQQALSLGYVPRSLLLAQDRVTDLAEVIEQAGSASIYVASYDVLKDVTGFHVHRGALASMERPKPLDLLGILTTARRIVILESIVDHTNVGAIFRTAAALGWDAVLISPECADPLYRRSVRVSMGAVLHLPWKRLLHWPQDLATVRDHGFTIVSLTPDTGAVELDLFTQALPDRIALLLGTEGDGLSRTALGNSDVQVRIPMANAVDSLNVGAAAAVACWELRVDGVR